DAVAPVGIQVVALAAAGLPYRPPKAPLHLPGEAALRLGAYLQDPEAQVAHPAHRPDEVVDLNLRQQSGAGMTVADVGPQQQEEVRETVDHGAEVARRAAIPDLREAAPVASVQTLRDRRI